MSKMIINKSIIALFSLFFCYAASASSADATNDKLRDVLTCKGNISKKQLGKLIRPFIKETKLKSKSPLVKLKEPINFWGIKTDTLAIYTAESGEIDYIQVIFKETPQQVAKKIPLKFKPSNDPEDDPFALQARIGSKRVYIAPSYNSFSPKYKSELSCLTL